MVERWLGPNNEVATITKLFESLAHPTRIAILMNVERFSLQQIAKAIGSSAPALQRHVNNLRERGLIEKDGRGYRLTDIGRQVVKLFDRFNDLVLRLRDREKEIVKEKIRNVVHGAGLTKDDLVKLLKDFER
jgi:predicted transcriptional regulator